jgi:hypothetical protein
MSRRLSGEIVFLDLKDGVREVELSLGGVNA